MKLAIVGSRAYPNLADVRTFVRTLPRDTLVITGGAMGVDTAAEETASNCRLSRMVFEPIVEAHATRETYRDALLERNKRIVEACDRLIAFHDGKSTGTMHTVAYARKLGREVEVRLPAVKP